MAVGDCSVTERRRWRPSYQTGKTVHVHAKHHKHNEDGRTAPGVYGNGSVPLSHSGNVVTRIGIHTKKTAERLAEWLGYSPFTQEIEGSTPSSGTCPNCFSDTKVQDLRTYCALSWNIVVSEWLSVIAMSLNIGSGVRLIKPAKLYMCTQKHYKHNEDGRTVLCVRGHDSVPLSHSVNVVTRIGLQQHMNTLDGRMTPRTAAMDTLRGGRGWGTQQQHLKASHRRYTKSLYEDVQRSRRAG